jgi:hypothetical protein
VGKRDGEKNVFGEVVQKIVIISFLALDQNWGARGSVVVKALCCKPEGRGFKSR